MKDISSQRFFHGGQHFGGGGLAVLGIFAESFVEDGAEGFRESLVALGDGDDDFVEDDVDGIAAFGEGIRKRAGEDVVNGGGHAPDVGDGLEVFESGNLLARHEERGSGVVASKTRLRDSGASHCSDFMCSK